MKILMVHNRYQQKGGEDAVVLSEQVLLRNHGATVEMLEMDNDSIVSLSSKISASLSVFTSPYGVGRLKAAIDRFTPDVVHVHNWFPRFSPAVFWACRKKRVPVVHTLHNYRLLCANGILFRNGTVCEDCIGTTLRAPGVIHGCYRDSRAGSAVVTAGMLSHWAAGTWHKAVDTFVALTEFARSKLIEGGLPQQKIVVKPNFLEYDPGQRPGDQHYVTCVGRLSDQKGIERLLQCWRENPDLPLLKIVGTGPLQEQVREAAAALSNVEWLGARNGDEVLNIMGEAEAVLCPSLSYEGMPRVVIEALAVGTPVLASRLGSYVEMIRPEFGALFDPYDPQGLSQCLRRLQDRHALGAMRNAARSEFEARYTAAINYKILLHIYENAIATSRGREIPGAVSTGE